MENYTNYKANKANKTNKTNFHEKSKIIFKISWKFFYKKYKQEIKFKMNNQNEIKISSTEEIISELQRGKMVIIVDDENRENEGDLLIAAEFVTPETINFMVTHARGLVCLTLTEEHCRRLGLSQMSKNNKSQYGTAFTNSIEAAVGVTTGISAADRALTIKTAVAKDSTADDIVQPGHVFPITARKGGVLVRAGHTEAGCDLTRLAGLTPAATICEIMNEDGTMARLPQLLKFAKEHNLKIGTIANLINYRSARESLVERVAERKITTPRGEFTMLAYKDNAGGNTHLVLQYGDLPSDGETLVRVHEPFSVLDFLAPETHKGSFTLPQAEEALVKFGHGVIVLLHGNENNNDSGENMIKRLNKTDSEKKSENAKKIWDPRSYGIGAQILRDMGIHKMILLSSEHRMPSMQGFGLEVSGFIQNIKEVPSQK